MPLTWQCVIRYHDQCLSSDNVSYGTTTSAYHLAMCSYMYLSFTKVTLSYADLKLSQIKDQLS
jgi:hypothetical protein